MIAESSYIAFFLGIVIRPVLLVVAAGLAIRLFRIQHPASQHAIWAAVLIGLLVVPVVSVMVPHVELAVLPASVSGASVTPHPLNIPPSNRGRDGATPDIHPLLLHEQGLGQPSSAGVQPVAASRTTPDQGQAFIQRASAVVYVYLAGVLIVATYRTVGWVLLRRVYSRSRRLKFGRLRASDDLVVPVAVGVFRPVVILPRDWGSWSVAMRRTVLAHEFAHIRRKDLLTSSLSRVVKCIFWFNPLAWWVSAKVSRLAELACDAVALQRTNDPAAYSRLLLEFAERVSHAGHRASVPGLAMVSSSSLRQRIDNVFSLSRGKLRKIARPGLILTVTGIPLVGAAAAVGFGQASTPAPVRSQIAAPPVAIVKPSTEPVQLAAVTPATVEPVAPVSLQSDPAVRTFLDENCVRCHNAKLSAAGVALDNIGIENPAADAKKWERVLRTLRVRSMPPLGMARADRATNDAVVAWLDRALDANASPAVWPVRTETLSDQDLAQRLATFLWSAPPDEELLRLVGRGMLKDPRVLEQQVKRMIADPRSRWFVANFFGGWLGLYRLPSLKPSSERFPDFDDSLRDAMQRETEMFLDNQLHEDRSALDLIAANYTFINERLARHYGIPNVSGSEFRRVALTDGRRAGLLEQGSILMLTSMPTRISPTVRGKWVLMNILGQVPPDPPPSIPPLPEDEPGKTTPMRLRMEQHLASAASCGACHVIMNPPGYALENFNAIGQWQDTEGGVPVDASGKFPDGTIFNGPSEFRAALMDRRDAILNNFAEKLLTYALGRLATNSTAPKLRALEYYEMPTVRAIVREAAASNYRWSALIKSVVTSAPFQSRVLDTK